MAHNKASRLKATSKEKLRALADFKRNPGGVAKSMARLNAADKKRQLIENPPRQRNPSATRRKRRPRSIRGRR